MEKFLRIPWSYKVPRSIPLGTQELAEYLANILSNKTDPRDFAVTVYGEKGVGKSITTAEIMRRIHQINNKDFKINRDIVFYLKDFYNSIKDAEKGTCRELDDFGSEADSRRSMETKAINLSHHFQTSRTRGVGYFITTPTYGWINKDMRERVPNYFIWITGKNHRKNYVTAKIWYLQKNEAKKKIYTHNLCFHPRIGVNNQGIGYPITEWHLEPLPCDLIKEYYPYRLAKAQQNIDKGLEDLIEEEEKIKTINFNPNTEADKILQELDKYYFTPPGRKQKTLDKGGIMADLGLSVRKYEQVKSIIMRRIK